MVWAITRFLALVLPVMVPISGLSFDPASNSENNIVQEPQYCLDCHSNLPVGNHKSHPVGIDYGLAQLWSRGKLKDPSQLDPALKLKNGQVTCSSCHDPNSQLPAKLVIENIDSGLCLSCHNL